MKEEHIFSLISQQTEYIDQLEKNNLFLKYQLQKFQSELKNVIEDNESLYEHKKAIVTRYNSAESKNKISTNCKTESQISPISLFSNNKIKLTRNKVIHSDLENWKAELTVIKTLYQTKIDKLKEQLLATNNELTLTKQLLKQKNSLLNSKSEESNVEILEKQNKDNMNDILLERLSLLKTIKGLNEAVTQGREQEVVLRQDLQNCMKNTEDLQLQVSHLQLCKANLESDVCDLNKKLETNLNNTKRLVEDAVEQQKKVYSFELNKIINDKNIFEKKHLKTVIDLNNCESENLKLKSSVDELYKDIYTKEKVIAGFKSMNQLNNNLKEKEISNKEISIMSVKSSLERNLQNEKNEKKVINQKLIKVGTRLEVSKQKALELQNLNIALNERVNSMHQKLSRISNEKEKVLRECKEQVFTLENHLEKLKNQNFNNIGLLEESYKCRLIELENLSSKQADLISKLKKECFKLEADLSSVSKKYEKGIKIIKKNNTGLLLTTKGLSQRNKELSDQCVKHGLLHKSMSKYIESIFENNKNLTINYPAQSVTKI